MKVVHLVSKHIFKKKRKCLFFFLQSKNLFWVLIPLLAVACVLVLCCGMYLNHAMKKKRERQKEEERDTELIVRKLEKFETMLNDHQQYGTNESQWSNELNEPGSTVPPLSEGGKGGGGGGRGGTGAGTGTGIEIGTGTGVIVSSTGDTVSVYSDRPKESDLSKHPVEYENLIRVWAKTTRKSSITMNLFCICQSTKLNPAIPLLPITCIWKGHPNKASSIRLSKVISTQ
ncbi:paired amphipathic helix containing protein, partial [Reticulomyxa filosa]